MIFTRNDLKQIDYKYLDSLPIDQLLNISFRFFQDLIQLHDFVNQTPLNSSRPPASFPPWQAKPLAETPNVEQNLHQGPEKKETGNENPATTTLAQKNEAGTTTTPAQKNEARATATADPKNEKKKPGKQVVHKAMAVRSSFQSQVLSIIVPVNVLLADRV